MKPPSSSSLSKLRDVLGDRGLVDLPRPGEPLRAEDEAMRAAVVGGTGQRQQ
jgi:hypothetical protein